MRRIKFRPKLRDTVRLNAAYLALMSPGGKLAPELQASHDALVAGMPKRRASHSDTGTRAMGREDAGVDIDAVHGTKRAAPLEAEVVTAISQLLASHPKVLFAVRQNSGAASYEAKSGKYAPVHFYRILTGQPVTVVDFWGILRNGRMLAIEAKRETWKAPSTDREFKQANFLALVRNCGGTALFATSADQVAAALA